MTKLFKNAALASAIAVAPFAANATTMLNDGGTETIGAGDSFFFQLASAAGDAGSTLTFNFDNASAASTTVAVTNATVGQFLASYTGGVEFAWSTGGTSTVAEGATSATGEFTTTIAAGGSSTLTVTYGDVVAGLGDTADIDVFISAVPLPAGGLLLLSAFGAVAVARRKKA